MFTIRILTLLLLVLVGFLKTTRLLTQIVLRGRILELHAHIKTKIYKVVDPTMDEHEKISLAERLHGESDNVDFLQSIIDFLKNF